MIRSEDPAVLLSPQGEDRGEGMLVGDRDVRPIATSSKSALTGAARPPLPDGEASFPTPHPLIFEETNRHHIIIRSEDLAVLPSLRERIKVRAIWRQESDRRG